jgi:hypothetical protein
MTGTAVLPSSLRDLAGAASDALGRAGLVLSSCVLGSVARGTTTAGSDVDLLVITPGRTYHSELFRALPEHLRDPRLSLIARTEAGWLRAVERGSLFVLHARLEGTIISDQTGWLAQTFVRAARIAPDVSDELRRQRRRLRVLRDVERFNGRFLFVLSDLFSIGKACAIAHCVSHGEPVFVKQLALARVAELRPDLAEQASVVARLQPFYERVRGAEVSLPFAHDGEVDRVREAIAAVEALARE